MDLFLSHLDDVDFSLLFIKLNEEPKDFILELPKYLIFLLLLLFQLLVDVGQVEVDVIEYRLVLEMRQVKGHAYRRHVLHFSIVLLRIVKNSCP